MEVIITDTVGFIKDLPRELRTAFRATLEELESADLLLHVIDISNPRFEAQIQSVETILEELGLENIPVLRVLNKMDLAPSDTVDMLSRTLDGIAVCAKDQTSLIGLIEKMAARVSEIRIKDRLSSEPPAEIDSNDIEA
jgi:GTP-binding protein HflX